MFFGVIALLALLGGVLVPLNGATASERPTVAAASDTIPSGIVPAADLSKFQPGNIIGDAVFFNRNTMGEAQIQSFLQNKVPSCQAGYTCLKDWYDTSRTTNADAMCGAYSGGVRERASTIIYKVAQACGINPQVILVMLQKEQGLVTHTWPSNWRYTIAMGQGCPDTAACDTRYYGFFNQVYGAAWQLKRYANPPGTSQYFTWYAPGKTWNVRYHPNAACGSSPVYIQNQATANLYYYTPYQPNAAALAAGYGEASNACSAYGNRNFYNYFTDWFGSTTAGVGALVRTEANPTVYLVSGTKRYSVTDLGDYLELARVYGAAPIVSDSYVSLLANAGPATALLRDESTGDMWLIQGSQRHKLLTCESVQEWGSTCAAPTNVSSALLNGIPIGASVSDYFTVRGTAKWGRMDAGSAVTPLWDAAAARAANGGIAPSAFEISPALYSAKTKGPVQFAPGQLVRSNENPQVYFTAEFSGLLSVGAWSDVAAYGRTSSNVAFVPQAELSARYTPFGAIAPTLRCAGVTHIASSGLLVRLTDPARAGLPANDVGAATCAAFPVASSPVSGPLFVKSATAPWVYLIESGKARRVLTWSALLAASGGVAPTILLLPDETLAALPAGTLVADGLLVKIGAGPTLSVVSGTTRHAITSLAAAQDAGIALNYTALSDADGAVMAEGPALGQWVRCGGVTWFVGGGRRSAVTDAAATGFAPLAVTDPACARIPAASTSALARVFVKSASGPQVYLADAGAYRLVTDWATLLRVTGGVVPPIVVMSDEVLAGLPKGSPVT